MIDYKKELNKEQYEAATYIDGPLRIFAGAGSGKTRTLIYRAAYMIENGIIPEQILLLTFTNKAAREMKERAMQMLDERCGKITACTYHSFCNAMLRRYADRIGWTREFTVINGNDAADIIDILKTERGYHKYRKFPQGKVVVAIISASKNKEESIRNIIGNDFDRFWQYIPEVEELAVAFEEYKKERFLMDYDDLLVYFYQLLVERPDIRDVIAEQYKYIMVDEYQDTNNIQERIILNLRENVHNIAVVGDDYQSIYAFRGSNVNNILEFEDKMDNVKTIKLEQNYRSGQPILDAANNIMKNNATEGVYKEMRSDKTCDKPKIHRPNSHFEERDVVMSIIEKELRNGTNPKEIAVLERRANESALIEAALTAEGIPFEKYGGLKFFDRYFVQDILAFLRIITNPHDEISWFRVLRLYPGIGNTYSQKLSKESVSKDVEFLKDNEFKRRAFYKELVQLYEDYQSWRGLKLEDALNVLIDYYHSLRDRTIKVGKFSDESVREDMLEENDEAKKDLQILKTMAKEYGTIQEFLDAIVLDATKKNDEEGIIISTIHSAKGLEFEVVIILDCVDGIFPSTTTYDCGTKEDNEELRCFYVALTRAKRELHVFCPYTVDMYGRSEFRTPSHYLRQCDEEFEGNIF